MVTKNCYLQRLTYFPLNEQSFQHLAGEPCVCTYQDVSLAEFCKWRLSAE